MASEDNERVSFFFSPFQKLILVRIRILIWTTLGIILGIDEQISRYCTQSTNYNQLASSGGKIQTGSKCSKKWLIYPENG